MNGRSLFLLIVYDVKKYKFVQFHLHLYYNIETHENILYLLDGYAECTIINKQLEISILTSY